MKRTKLAVLSLFFSLWASVACAQLMLTGVGQGSSSAPSVCTEATTFLARANAVTTLDATHTNAYTDYICGLVTDGIWTKFDVLMVYATQSEGVALLNLPNATYTATNGSMAFTVDAGFFGNSSTNFITTTFNPSTASSPHYVQDSAHLSTWSLSAAPSNTPLAEIAGAASSSLFVKYTDDKTYFFVNDSVNPAGFTLGVSPAGFYLGNRDGATTRQGYRNGVSVGSFGSVNSAAVNNAVLLGGGDASAPNNNSVASISAGGSFNATDQLNYYTRTRTYMTAVSVP